MGIFFQKKMKPKGYIFEMADSEPPSNMVLFTPALEKGKTFLVVVIDLMLIPEKGELGKFSFSGLCYKSHGEW